MQTIFSTSDKNKELPEARFFEKNENRRKRFSCCGNVVQWEGTPMRKRYRGRISFSRNKYFPMLRVIKNLRDNPFQRETKKGVIGKERWDGGG